ncbi:MAG TPA: lamin tail domain-containing protein [Candidatus Saccharimonadales bacterium]|nr:lamin tail domain-containing protein [Candidatus Saccharimonadales bacterium]
MRRIITIFQTTILSASLACVAVIGIPHISEADTASAPSLVISQLKITSGNGQFVTLYNTTNTTLDMSKYQLEYFNSYDLTKTSSSKLLALSGSVPPHSYFIVSDDSLRLCYQAGVDSVSLGFSSTAGMLEVMAAVQASSGSAVSSILQDYVSWSKTAISGAQTLPQGTDAFLQRQPGDVAGNPSITIPGAGSWQAVRYDTNDPCSLVSISDSSDYVQNGMASLLPGAEPAATIISIGGGNAAVPVSLPVSDIGLMAPSITELLPNPNGSGNDSTDEFIELYNPNAVSFDLSGFELVTGTTTLHRYAFPAGTHLSAHGFTAFYSAITKLSLSNNGSQVKLLDPFGNSISASGLYGSAKDGEAWALAKGKWYWTSEPTPGKPNVIKEPANAKKVSAKKSASKQKTSKSKVGAAAAYGDDQPAASGSHIHVWTLAIIGGLALLYGAYEYRTDVANYLSRVRGDFKDRRSHRT